MTVSLQYAAGECAAQRGGGWLWGSREGSLASVLTKALTFAGFREQADRRQWRRGCWQHWQHYQDHRQEGRRVHAAGAAALLQRERWRRWVDENGKVESERLLTMQLHQQTTLRMFDGRVLVPLAL